jgi:hypothetical protein
MLTTPRHEHHITSPFHTHAPTYAATYLPAHPKTTRAQSTLYLPSNSASPSPPIRTVCAALRSPLGTSRPLAYNTAQHASTDASLHPPSAIRYSPSNISVGRADRYGGRCRDPLRLVRVRSVLVLVLFCCVRRRGLSGRIRGRTRIPFGRWGGGCVGGCAGFRHR